MIFMCNTVAVHLTKVIYLISFFFQKQRGDTALHISLRARSKKITELLLRNPRNSQLLYRPNKAGETPYQIDAYHQKGILTQIYGHSRLSVNWSSFLLAVFPSVTQRETHLLTIILPKLLNEIEWNFHRIFITYFHCARPILEFRFGVFRQENMDFFIYEYGDMGGHLSQLPLSQQNAM